MNSITKPDHLDNIGGIIKLWFVPVEHIASISRPIHDYAGFILEADRVWFELYFSPQSASYSFKFKSDNKGSYYQCKIVGVIPRQDNILNTSINQLRDRAFVCKVLDANGHYRIVGTQQSPLRLVYEFDSGNKPSDRNSVGFTFFCNSRYAPFFITSQQGQQSW